MSIRAPYLLAWTIPASFAVSIQMSGPGAYFSLIYAFGILPVLDAIFPPRTEKISASHESSLIQDRGFDLILWAIVPLQILCLSAFLGRFSESDVSGPDRIGWILSMGVCCGVMGINAAHELGHRKSRIEQVLARLLLATSLYWQFFVEHNRGHHKNVATPEDSESAHFNESLPAFWLRSLYHSYRNSWRIDSKEMLMGSLVQCLLLLGIILRFGWLTCGGFIFSALIGALLLQSVNYIEHYGLERRQLPGGGYEKVLPIHSWNSSHPLSRYVLFELSRHSDHHAHARRKYQILRHLEEAPQLPAGYPAMILLACVPPLWFRVMNPRIQNPRMST
jgi:alkane 1-monooxygenase